MCYKYPLINCFSNSISLESVYFAMKSYLHMAMLALVSFVVSITNIAAQDAALTSQNCCGVCLAGSAVAGVDAVDWDKCNSAKSICCFDNACKSSAFGQPNMDASPVTFDGSNTIIESGQWFQISWPTASAVKFMILKDGQPKISQVTNTSQVAVLKDNYFFMCASTVGTLYYRGFANNSCTASKELMLNVRLV